MASLAPDHAPPRGFVAAQRRVVVPLFLAAAAACLLAPPPHAVQVALLLGAVAAGMPHGALDGRTGRAVFAPRHGARWRAPFLLGYAGLATAMLVLWRIAPGVALASFLVLAVVHFGEGRGWAARLAAGAAPVVAPALAHPREITALFAELAGRADAEVLTAALAGPGAVLWLAACAVAARRERPAGRVAEGVATVALFIAAPPLVALALYFALLHAPRALMKEAGSDIARAVRDALPLTGAALLLGAAWWAAGGPDMSEVRASFHLLSALTLPHMWLATLARRSDSAAAGTD